MTGGIGGTGPRIPGRARSDTGKVEEHKQQLLDLLDRVRDRIRNERIRGTVKVGLLGQKIQRSRLRWFGYVEEI